MSNKIKTIIIILIIFLNCTIKLPDDPKAPIWDVKITRLPLFKADTLRIGDELKPEDFKRIGTDSLLFISVGDTSGFSLEDKLSIPENHQSFRDKLGDLSVDIAYSVEQVVSFAELYPQYVSSVGQKAVIPPIDLVPITKEITLNEFLSMSITTGRMNIIIENHLGFVLGDDTKLDLLDRGNGNSLIQTIDSGRIEDGETEIFPVNLDGKFISAQFSVRIYGSLVGTEGREVQIPSNSGFSVRIGPDYLSINSAVTKLPAQTLSADLSGELDINSDSLRINYAMIKSGYLQFRTNNESELPVRIEITIPNLKRNGNEILTLGYEVNPKFLRDYQIPLDRLKLDMVENAKLLIQTRLIIAPEAGKFYSIKSDDSLKIDVSISEIELQSITADINLSTPFPEINETVFDDPPRQLDNIDFNDVILRLSFPESQFNLDLKLNIIAVRDNISRTLIVDHVVEKGESLILSKEGINYNGETPTIKDILNMIPESIIVKGIVGVRGDDVTFNRDDDFSIVYSLDVPLMFSLINATYTDFDSLTIEEDVRDDIREFLLEAHLDVTVENGIPLSGKLNTFIGTDSMYINTSLFSVDLPQPVLMNGVVQEPGISVVSFSLTEEKIEALSQSRYYRYQCMLNNSNLSALTANDYIIIKNVYISGKFKVDPEGLSEEE
ncbi:hypothetical protein JXB12_06455 [candidate division KSB1 bacterium]|nr:hypothetical protein [candidate division KSB1 bacterium]